MQIENNNKMETQVAYTTPTKTNVSHTRKEVRKAMIERGIRPERIEIEGRGERDPIVPNTSEDNRQMNRRVEIVLI